jgi:hypothetical protein
VADRNGPGLEGTFSYSPPPPGSPEVVFADWATSHPNGAAHGGLVSAIADH